MKRNILTSAVALATLTALSACGGGAADAPAEDTTTEEAAPVEEAATEEAAPEVEPVPEVEANGTVIEIEMYIKDPDDSSALQVFKPRLVTAKVGDTVKFIPTEATHQSSSIDGMIPAGVTGWEGKINQEVSFVIPTEGVYGYKCVPHYAAGMVGMVVVEGGDNIDAAKAVTHPGRAGKVFEEIFAEAGL